jgi:hypothetical protein
MTFTKGNKHGRAFMMKAPAKPTLGQLEKKLDKVFSEYVRRKDADEGGTVRCVTCPKLMHWKESDCGHFVKRQHRSVRWDTRNVGTQCTRCNHFMGGVQDQFAQHIIAEHGVQVFDELLQLKHLTVKWTRIDLEEKINFYKAKIKDFA